MIRLALGILALLVVIIAAAVKPRPAALPHRPMHEVDIQGHQAGTPDNRCPGAYEYLLDDGTFLECWGNTNAAK